MSHRIYQSTKGWVCPDHNLSPEYEISVFHSFSHLSQRPQFKIFSHICDLNTNSFGYRDGLLSNETVMVALGFNNILHILL